MDFFREISSKPWLESQVAIDDTHQGRAYTLPSVTIGLRVFLGVVTVLFSLTVVAYSDRMTLADWRPVPEPTLMWLNIVVLFASSVAMQWSVISARRGRTANVEIGMLVGGALALAFLAGQLLMVRQMNALGYFAPTNPALAFLYMLSAMHGVHLLGGLVAWGRTVMRIWGGHEAHQVRMSVELCAFYWHFLLVVWFLLFVWFSIT
ncbi:MAG: cytochrome c oxidase subunit 3 [Alphaproteobacteria bacterium]|nr:cytochrome c oxidase subunit 3 [Alphaproteobacteria bacterium]